MHVRRAAGVGSAIVGAAVWSTGALGVAAPAVTVVSGMSVHPLISVAGPPYPKPPTIKQCEATRSGRACYGPAQLHAAYDMNRLYAAGLDGHGKTIVVVDSFGSPTIRADLARFDADFGLPAPPSFKIVQPAGPVHHNISDPVQGVWGLETSLDVEWAHAMAPGANILLVETPVAETEGLVGIPQIVQSENWVISHHMGDVISQSFGATEETFPNAQALLQQRSAFKAAAAAGIPVLASSGDTGPTDYHFNLTTLFTHRVNSWPSSDPLVTSVGGTELHLTQAGHRSSPDTVWNQTAFYGTAVAGGGGDSHIFARPDYQDPVASIVGPSRGTPDISLSASTNGGAITYIGYTSPGVGISGPGYYVIGGTSESSPLFSGIVAIAEQAAGHDLGPLNPALYRLGLHGAAGIPDITVGNNNVTFTQNGSTFTVPGFSAVPGYDMASGLGTVDGFRLVNELAH